MNRKILASCAGNCCAAGCKRACWVSDRRSQCFQLAIFEVSRARIHAGYVPPGATIQHPQPQYISACESPASAHCRTDPTRTSSGLQHLLCGCSRVMFHFALDVICREIAVVQKRCLQFLRAAIQYHAFVHQTIRESSCTPFEQTQHKVGIPAGMMNECSAELRQARAIVAFCICRTHCLHDLGLQFR